MKKILTTILLTCTIILPNTISIFAQENNNMVIETNETIINQEKQLKETRLNVTTTVYLNTGKWINVTSDNNILRANVDVTNCDGNGSDVEVRIINKNGNVICGPAIVYEGTTVRFGPIPANSGTYSVQAMALTDEGYFNFKVKD